MNNATPQPNPLENLRDIHLPDPISAWPPAPGWWILAILVLSLISFIIWKLWKRHQQQQLSRLSLAAVTKLEQDYAKHQDPQRLLRQYSSLLRRVALARFPRQQVASLTGSSWLDFLNNSTSSNLFTAQLGQLLLQGPYQKSDKNITQIDELGRAIHLWIKAIGAEGVHHD
mgnify:CR=1 FL=1